MASEILGLFGGKSSQQLRGDALDGLLVSPAQMGNQSLLQQVVSMGRNAGAVAGMGAGQLLGGKVAGEVEASYIDEAIKNASTVEGTPAQKMKAVADFLADKPGMGAQYMKAMEEAKKLELTDLQTQKAQQDLRPEFKNVKVPVDTLEMGADGKMYPVRKSIELTYKWDKEKNDYVLFQGDAQGAPKPEGGTAGGMGGFDKDAIAAQIAKNEAAKAKATEGQTPPASTEDLKRLATTDPAKYAEELRRQEAAAGEAARAELNKPKDYSNEGRNNQRMVFSSEIDKQRAAARAWSEGRMKDFQIISQAVVVPRK